jgi:hypothetical protein
MTAIFLDGTSNTLMITENMACGNSWSSRSAYYAENSDYNAWGWSYKYQNPVGVKNSVSASQCYNYYNYLTTSRVGGIQIAMGDGSVRMVNTTASAAQLYSLMDPQDGGDLPNF